MQSQKKARKRPKKPWYESYIRQPVETINKWLEPFDLSVSVMVEKLPPGRIGEYEHDSVFTKCIEVRVDINAIKKVDDDPAFIRNETALTIYHEVGHALVNQIVDWMENIKEMDDLVNGELGETYPDVFNDDVPEETLVEEFAQGFFYGENPSLKRCFEELNEKL